MPEQVQLILGDALQVLDSTPEESVQCCVTSPPYWGLRDYGVSGQIGAEMEVTTYIENLVSIFRKVRKVLTPTGTLWLNIGDSYTSGGRTWRDDDAKNKGRGMSYRPPTPKGLKPKDLIGVPWRLAFALQEDGWYLRTDIIWNKPNCQPESVKDRPTRCHEYVFLLTKEEKYYFDHKSIAEPADNGGLGNGKLKNRRTVWNIHTKGYAGAHFAVFPPFLVELCILAGSKRGQLVLDPFLGTGTTGIVAIEKGRRFMGIELKKEFLKIAKSRISSSTPELSL